MNNIINKNYNGLLVIKAKNANFNAGFDKSPRTLPNGTIYATDKVLKYCLREYFSLFKNNIAFVRRNRKLIQNNNNNFKFTYELLSQNFISKIKYLVEIDKFNSVPENILDDNEKKEIINFFEKNKKELEEILVNKNNKEIDKKFKKLFEDDKLQIKILKCFLDVRLFGVVFAVSGNISLTGPVQISYGINKFDKSNIFALDILSPYKNPNAGEKGNNISKNEDSSDKEEKIINQTTIGEETRADEVYYVYNISINAKNAENTFMNLNDLNLLKEGLLNSVDTITSTTKFGCEAVSLIWFKNKNNEVFNNLDDFITIEEKNNRIELNYSKLKEFLGREFKDISYKFGNKIDEDNTDDVVQIYYKKDKIWIEEKINNE